MEGLDSVILLHPEVVQQSPQWRRLSAGLQLDWPHWVVAVMEGGMIGSLPVVEVQGIAVASRVEWKRG